MPDGDYIKFCRKGKDRYPQEHVEAVTKKEVPRFRSRLGWRNYEIAMASHDPADADLYAKAFVRFAKDTTEFRRGRTIDATRHRGTAHCHRAHWLIERKDFAGDECLFFPSMAVGFPVRLKYNYRTMAAARAMLTMTKGLPPDGKDYGLHICGNGHLSCVNPQHLRWGNASDNAKDAAIHNAPSGFIAGMDRDAIDAIRASTGLVKVVAWQTGIPAGVVSAIKRGEQFVT